MATVSFLIQLAGAAMLLLFAVRMVRTGIERSYGASFRRIMTRNEGAARASVAGVMLAVILQSSAAVAVLAAGFSASGLLAFGTGLAIVLGGDLGSALVIQILSFQLEWLVPLLLAIGGWLFVKSDQKKWRQTGRILMGIAFILISLRFLREAMDPIRDSVFLPAIADYLARDYITAFLAGAALAFVMHSSVAAILMCVTLVNIGAIPFAAGLSLVLGANLGSAFIPIWLTRGMTTEARHIPLANMLLRGAWAVLVLLSVNLLGGTGAWVAANDGQMLVNAHVAFNLSLLILALPFCHLLQAPMQRLLAEPGPAESSPGLSEPPSRLDQTAIDNPKLANSSLKRELLRMIDLVERMFVPALELYESGDRSRIKAVRQLDQHVNEALSGVRSFVAAMPKSGISKSDARTARSMVEYAIRLETAGDVVAKRLMPLALMKHKKGVRFSSEGWSELERMHEAIAANIKLASNVLISDDLESARLLVIEKTEIKRAERDSRKSHLRRLQDGTAKSFETSDIHLETLRALREFNSHISAVAYPILHENGQLLETRLIETMKSQEVAG